MRQEMFISVLFGITSVIRKRSPCEAQQSSLSPTIVVKQHWVFCLCFSLPSVKYHSLIIKNKTKSNACKWSNEATMIVWRHANAKLITGESCLLLAWSCYFAPLSHQWYSNQLFTYIPTMKWPDKKKSVLGRVTKHWHIGSKVTLQEDQTLQLSQET